VTLNWNPSAGSVDGYNLYRGTVSGGPYTRINSALDTSTTAVDNTVISGQTYYYVVTAVAGSKESAYSNQATAAIPTP
jgi:fibronectin type 3 domain-containing protein